MKALKTKELKAALEAVIEGVSGDINPDSPELCGTPTSMFPSEKADGNCKQMRLLKDILSGWLLCNATDTFRDAFKELPEAPSTAGDLMEPYATLGVTEKPFGIFPSLKTLVRLYNDNK